MFEYEHKKEPLLPTKKFYRRLITNILMATGVIFISLVIGVAGYMSYAGLNFVDALENSSMILGGMGPVDVLHSDSAKYFASFYALFSGITFLTTIAVLLAPVLHRAMHIFHIETEEEEEK
ncbi:MAG: hypothetical protein ABUL44_04850 [Flavobacterium sp.]